jgi:hypothetical protein
MELVHIKDMEEAVKKNSTWTAKKLVFKIDEATMIDIVPYLSGSPKFGETLSFPNPLFMTQNEKRS